MKKCSKCGKEFTDEISFCTVCGTPLEEVTELQAEEVVKAAEAKVDQAAPAQGAPSSEAAPAAKKPNFFTDLLAKFKAMSTKSKALLGGICAIVILAIVAICCLGGKKDYRVNKNAIALVLDADADAYFVYNGKGQHKKIAGAEKTITRVLTAPNGESLVVKDDEDNYYILTIKGLTKFAEEGSRFTYSAGSSAVAYLAEGKKDDGLALYVYNIKSKKSVKVADEVGNFIISSNGKHVCYVDETDDDPVSYVVRNLKNKTKIGKNTIPVAVSDNGRLVYFTELTTDKKDGSAALTFNLLKGNSKKVITKDLNSDTFVFNKNLTQVIFKSDDKIRLSVNGKEPASLAKGSLSGVFLNAESASFTTKTGYSVKIIFANTLKGGILVSSDSLYYIKNLKNADKILNAESIGSLSASYDYKALLYVKDDNVYYMPNIKNPDKVKKVADLDDYDLDQIWTSRDLKSFYFESDDNLYYVKNGRKPKLICEDVFSACYDYTTDTIYYYKDYSNGDANDLYGSKNGRKNKKVLKKVVDTDSTRGGVPTALRESKNDDYAELFILNGYRTKNVKIKVENN